MADIFILLPVLFSQNTIFCCIDSTVFILYGSSNQFFRSHYNTGCFFCRAHENGNFIERKNFHLPRHLMTAAVLRDTKRWAACPLTFIHDTDTSRNLTIEFPPLQYCQWTLCDSRNSDNKRVGTLIVATIYWQLIQNRYMFRSFTVLHCSHQHCVQPVASDVEVVGYL